VTETPKRMTMTMLSSSLAKSTRTRAGHQSGARDWVSAFGPSYVPHDYLLRCPDFSLGSAARLDHSERSHDAFCLFSFIPLSCFAALLISHVYRPSSRFFAHFARICCESNLVSPWLRRRQPATRRITNTPPITFGRLYPRQQPGPRG